MNDKKWYRIFDFPSLVHICDMSAASESDVYDPRIGGNGEIVIQECEPPAFAKQEAS